MDFPWVLVFDQGVQHSFAEFSGVKAFLRNLWGKVTNLKIPEGVSEKYILDPLFGFFWNSSIKKIQDVQGVNWAFRTSSGYSVHIKFKSCIQVAQKNLLCKILGVTLKICFYPVIPKPGAWIFYCIVLFHSVLRWHKTLERPTYHVWRPENI